MASKIVKFTVKKGEKGESGDWDTCVVQRGVARALKINVKRVCIAYRCSGHILSNSSNCVGREITLFPRTQRLLDQHDSGQSLTPGVYSVRITDNK